jgi:hypothetical protein
VGSQGLVERRSAVRGQVELLQKQHKEQQAEFEKSRRLAQVTTVMMVTVVIVMTVTVVEVVVTMTEVVAVVVTTVIV